MNARAVETPYSDEGDLVAAAIRNERRAQDALYNRYAGGIYRLAHRMTGDPDLASDLTQDTFIRGFRSLATFRHESTFHTWLYRIALSVIVSGLRSRKRKEARHVPLEMAGAIGATHVHADEPVRRKLYAAIDALPPGYRTVFVLHEIEGFSHAEIARSLGVSESTSQGQLFRARAKLRESLSSLAGELRS